MDPETAGQEPRMKMGVNAQHPLERQVDDVDPISDAAKDMLPSASNCRCRAGDGATLSHRNARAMRHTSPDRGGATAATPRCVWRHRARNRTTTWRHRKPTSADGRAA